MITSFTQDINKQIYEVRLYPNKDMKYFINGKPSKRINKHVGIMTYYEDDIKVIKEMI